MRVLECIDEVSRPCEVTFDEVEVEAVLAEGAGAQGLVAEFDTLGRLMASVRLAGVIEEVVDMSVQYAKDRVQFDHPIGSFQAVQHRLADMAVLRAGANSAVAAGIRAVAAGSPGAEAAVRATKAYVSRAGRSVVESGLQVHGGVGFTDEYRLQLYFKHALRLQANWGSELDHEVALGAAFIAAS